METVFDQSYFWLVETIIGIRGEQFSKKELILASGQLVFRLMETVSFLQGNPYFRLVETEFRANNGFHKKKKTCK